MKNLLTLLFLVISVLAFGQSNSQSLEVEIKYWKSIAESNDTVAYREYLQRYGEDGLYKDEALTRITLLKTSGKQAQSKNIECCFYSIKGVSTDIQYVVRFDAEQKKIWFRRNDYDTVRSYLSTSRDFYECQATLALTRGTWEYKDAIRKDKDAIWQAEYARKYERNRRKKAEALQKAEQAKSPDYYKNAWTADEEYEYDPMKSTSTRDVYFKRDCFYEIHYKGNRNNHRKILYFYSDDGCYYSLTDGSGGKIYKTEYDYYKDMYDYHINTIKGFRYIAFSKNKYSFIMWFEEDNNLDGQIFEKREYYRIPKEALLPKTVNYDFLNE